MDSDAQTEADYRQRRDALLEQLLDAAPADRPALLAALTGDAPALRAELDALLAAAERMDPAFLDPAVSQAPPHLAPGTVLGRYVVEGLLGVGGMSAVYAAHDPAVGRAVAIKVLVPWADDQAWRERFFAELRILGRITHDNVVRVYDFGEDHGLLYLVTERLEGEDLARAIANGRTGDVARKIDIARQMATALRDVHAAGIVHRDLKPANVFLTLGGRVKLIDFGISRSDDGRGRTATGLVAGTPEYMAPERLASGAVSPLVDIYSYGTVLFELFSGRRPFSGTTAEVVHTAPTRVVPVEMLPAETPAAIVDLIRRTTAPDPRGRLQTFSDVLAQVDRAAVTEPSRQSRPRARSRRLAAALGIAALGLLAIAGVWFARDGRASRTTSDAAPLTVTQVTSFAGTEMFPSLSPDGRWIVFDSDHEGNDDIFLQAVGGQNPINLTKNSSKDDYQAAFSPDGETIAFRSERDGGGLFVMGRTGESVRRISTTGFNPAWSPDGRSIVAATESTFDPSGRVKNSQLLRISVRDGSNTILTRMDGVQPSWSPHGARVAYWAVDGENRARDIWTVPADGGTPVRVTNDDWTDWNPVWAPSGDQLYFLSNRGGTMNVWRVAIDEETGEVRSAPQPVTIAATAMSHLSLAASGPAFAFSSMTFESNAMVAEFDPIAERIVGEPRAIIAGTRAWSFPSPSPDGMRATVSSSAPFNEDVWVVNSDGSNLTQLTNDGAFDRSPRWSPDGTQIAFYSSRENRQQVWTVRPDGSGLRRVTNEPGQGLVGPIWSPDGRLIAASSQYDNSLVMFDPSIAWRAQQPRRISGFPGALQTVATGWFAKGNVLACQILSDGSPRIFASLLSLDTGKWQVVPGGHSFRNSWLDTDSRFVATTANYNLAVFDLERHQKKEILDTPGYSAFAPDLSADRRHIFFLRQGQRTGDIYVAKAVVAGP